MNKISMKNLLKVLSFISFIVSFSYSIYFGMQVAKYYTDDGKSLDYIIADTGLNGGAIGMGIIASVSLYCLVMLVKEGSKSS